jgi:hypothetical protein
MDIKKIKNTNFFKTTKFLIILNYFLTFSSIIILVLRTFYPYHRYFAFIIYFLSWIVFVYAIIKFNKIQKLIKENKSKINFVKKHIYYFINTITLLFVGYLLIVLFPINNFEYLDIDKNILQEKVEEDIYAFQIYQDGQKDILTLFEQNKHILNKDFNHLTLEEKELLLSLWSSYLDYSREIDFLTQTHKFFYQINYIEEPELNSKSFLIAYSSFITNYQSFLKLNNMLNKSSFVKTLFNEENKELNINKNSYLFLSHDFVNVNNIIRINAGYEYVIFVELNRKNITNEELFLINYTKKTYLELNNLMFDEFDIFIESPLNYFEKNTFETWFPAQKGIAEGMSYLKFSLREEYITEKNLDELNKILIPGDIFVQRREGHLTNVGIPGFWTHAALFLGTNKELENYFKEIISEKDLKELINKTNERFYIDYYSNNNFSVIEAVANGVILNDLYTSASADYLGVLRANISKEDKLFSVIEGISHYKKPYDYNFDFITNNEVVCSELVFKSYHLKNSSKGIPFELEISSGRLMLSPNNIVKQYDEKLKDEYLIFVAYLNYDKNKNEIIFDSENNFRKSWIK